MTDRNHPVKFSTLFMERFHSERPPGVPEEVSLEKEKGRINLQFPLPEGTLKIQEASVETFGEIRKGDIEVTIDLGERKFQYACFRPLESPNHGTTFVLSQLGNERRTANMLSSQGRDQDTRLQEIKTSIKNALESVKESIPDELQRLPEFH